MARALLQSCGMSFSAVRFLTLACLFAAACSDEDDPMNAPADAGMMRSDAGQQTAADSGVSADSGVVENDAGVVENDAGMVETDSGVEEDTEITARFAAIAETFERQRVDFGAPGAALLIMEGGEITFARGFGVKDTTTN